MNIQKNNKGSQMTKKESYNLILGEMETKNYFAQEMKKIENIIKKMQAGKISARDLSIAECSPLFTHSDFNGQGHGHIAFVIGEFDFEIFEDGMEDE